ncbi:ATP phosphoribosyltransferase regulatory subunit [Sulfuritalea hydrogenivorans]|uniref:ATP phosphoribosyltransferase regulatory subunit n=1 Tax=Sulfuritalea hydrogenivorans sk43H TaxID=1223802 RepID=W0SDM0_9PROT|nr:ATP phosphoribosyltransferase regulatory subunit [Sulfuritalea hydrogenivorans]BAO28870.1 ATP phosphoribosyltransferase [Sulfuritalea hydrogenivorans sk43H]
MTNPRWLLPEAIEDVLPRDAARIEALRRGLLDEFARHGYEFVIPPLLEYVESLLTGSGHDLDLRTFKLVDQLSGRSMGVRADITPQVARIDAHLLNRKGVTRLCYCGSALHTLPAGFNATREPLQIGAELYGHAGLEADIEAIRLLAVALGLCKLAASRFDLGHVAVFRALAKHAGLAPEAEEELFGALQGKDVPTVRELVAGIADPIRSALLALPELYGDRRVLDSAAQILPALPEITAALSDLRRLADALADLPLSFDLADLRGYHYHSGVAFAAYCAGAAGAVALGGRYDDFGRAYGRARPATGFSMDLRELARLSPNEAPCGAILAPWPEDDALHAEALRLRAAGERVVLALPGHEGTWREAGCDRILVRRGDNWIIESLKED